MMYLSRLFLNPRDRMVRSDMKDCQSLHRTVMAAFEDLPEHTGAARAELAVLHRVEQTENGQILLLVQSAQRPDWGHLGSGYLAAAGMENPAVKEVSQSYTDAVVTGRTFRFRLHANPTKKVPKVDERGHRSKNGRRVPIRDETERLKWLQRKGINAGFEPMATRLNADVPDVSSRDASHPVGGRKGDRHALRFEGVTFDGRLRVTDPERFREALAKGVGPGKAYGFGLLSIAT